MCLVHIRARRFDEGIAVCKKVSDEDPTFALTHLYLSYAYWGKRMYPQAIEELRIYAQLATKLRNRLGHGTRISFRGLEGALTRRIEIMLANRKTGYASPYRIASLYADLGDKDQAFRWLSIAYQERDWQLEGLKADFYLDPLRSDPRFAELVRKVGLPQ